MIYSTIPFVFLFGLTEFSVRLASVFYGVLAIIAVYFLGQSAKNHRLGLAAALFLAISPWHIHFSRIAFEITPFVFFATLGGFYWLKHWVNKKELNLFLSIFCFVLALYSYFPGRIFIPLLAIFLIISKAKEFWKDKPKLMRASLFGIVLVAPMIIHVFFGPGLSRWEQVKGQQQLSQTAKTYLNHYSFPFLFGKGDIDLPGQSITRHSIKGIGELYLFQLPLLIIGLFVLGKTRKENRFLFLSWLILYPVGTIATNAFSPQATRSIIGVIPFQIISAFGLATLIKFTHRLKNSLRLLGYFIIFLTIGLSFFHFLSLYGQYPQYSSNYRGWQWGFRPIISFLKSKENEYDQLLITHRFNRGEELLEFYSVDISCLKCKIAPNPIRPVPNAKQLIVVRKEGLEEIKNQFSSQNIKIIKTFQYPNKRIAFWAVEIP